MAMLPTLGQLSLIDSMRRRRSTIEIDNREVDRESKLLKTSEQLEEEANQDPTDSRQLTKTLIEWTNEEQGASTTNSASSINGTNQFDRQVIRDDGGHRRNKSISLIRSLAGDEDDAWQGPGIDKIGTIYDIAAEIYPHDRDAFRAGQVIKYNLTGGYSHWDHDPQQPFGNKNDFDGLSLNPERQELIRDVFKYLSNTLNITFIEDNTFTDFDNLFENDINPYSEYDGYISFGDVNGGLSYCSQRQWLDRRSCIINIDNNLNPSAGVGSKAWTHALHEIGHALGLSHPGAYNYDPNPDSENHNVTFERMAEFYNDTNMLTIMSYFKPNNSLNGIGSLENPNIFGPHMEQATLMPADFVALRGRYEIQKNNAAHGDWSEKKIIGVNTTITNEDPIWNQVESQISTSRYFYTQVANHNEDTVDFSNTTKDQKIDLRVTTGDEYDAAWSDIGGGRKNLAFSEVSVFEVAKSGGGDDILIGNNANNALFGNDGDDHLTGWGGDDDLIGGQGDDELFGGTGNDLMIAGEGDDYLSGSTGINEMYGGLGRDTFVLTQGSGHSTIHDFSGIDDQIELVDGGEGISIMNNLDGNTSIYQHGDLLGIVNGKSANALEVSGNYIVGVVNYM